MRTGYLCHTSKRAEERVANLSRLLSNVGGPRSGKTGVMIGIVHSILLYGAPVWQNVLKYKREKERLIKVQRKMLLRVISSYRTVSAVEVQVVTGIPPIDLLIEERARVHSRTEEHTAVLKEEERRKTLQAWQKRWAEENSKGQ